MYYVTATDKFMSGWGLAKGKTNKVIVICENWQEDREVKDALHSRDEMKYINVRSSKPYYNNNNYVISLYRYCKNARFKFSE